ncbi:unnamed protein product [Hyaloperonospora brassicae]|uniref:Ubiquitin-like domain-containing protein n=1 Tax=Hyaloperonospora brassicae TaxID=162125 RepID=A0AAV0T8K2_HYABA|nr:unnamed protein product [Hyaloperonospora brassicae]
MTVPSDAPLRDATALPSVPTDAVQEPVAEPAVTEDDGAQLALKVRTLDQKTYPITICAAASVPQLKELVAMETGVTLPRQRLIYRGRVLKNDQMLASYALEDGHVLHLVVRALPPPSSTDIASTDNQQQDAAAAATSAAPDRPAASRAATAAAPNSQFPPSAMYLEALDEIAALNARLEGFDQSALRTRSRSRLRQRRARLPPAPPRDNDEPDPTMGQSSMGAQPGRVLMGATITVPEGTNVTMPFLSSMIADLATQVSENTGSGGEAGGATLGVLPEGQRHVAFSGDVLGGAIAAEMDTATTRALRHHHRNRDTLGDQRTARRSFSGADRQAALRARTGLRLESVRATLDDSSLDFPAELTALPQGDNNTAMSELQQQVEMLLTLLERFGPRLRLLPAALARRDHASERAATASVESDIVSTDPFPPTSASTGPHLPSELPTASSLASVSSGAVPLGGASPAQVGHSAASVDTSAVAESRTGSAGSNTAAVDLASASTDPNTAPAESDPGSTLSTGSTGSAVATLSARQVIRTIEALQTIGESTDLLARMARHAFVRRTAQPGEPIARRGDAGGAGPSIDDRIQARFHAIRAGPGVANTARTSSAVGDRMHAALQAATRTARQGTQGASNARPRIRVARLSASDLTGGRHSAAASTVAAFPTGQSGIASGFPISLARISRGAVPLASGPETSAQSSSQPSTGAEAVSSDGNGPLSSAGAPVSISGVGLPLMSSVVFPFSLAAGLGGSHATTTWNLADFVSRLMSELPISTLYGVMAGDATHLHHMLAHVGFALFSGVDVPRVTRPSIRTWAQDLVGELRSLLQLHELPADVVDQVHGTVERRSALGSELLRAVDPFMVDLVDLLVRATSASRAAAFGTSSATFLRGMAQQVLGQLRSYARGDSSESEDESDERLKRLLRGLLVWLGLVEHMAYFVVDSLLSWAEGDSRRGQRRQREEASSDVTVADSPATKRRRG